MDNKYNNGDGVSGRYQQNKWGDKKNNKYPMAEKSGGIPSGAYSNGLTYTNESFYFYCKKFGVNKTHTFGLHEAWKK